MVLQDIPSPDYVSNVFMEDGSCSWDTYTYDHKMQAQCDQRLKKHVSPGYGGVSQEMWVAAPPDIRARERDNLYIIIRIGIIPDTLLRKQLVFLLKKEDGYSTINLEDSLPPWRPIMVQTALSSRIFMALRNYVSKRIPNEAWQFGFQKDKTSHDAALLVRLLF